MRHGRIFARTEVQYRWVLRFFTAAWRVQASVSTPALRGLDRGRGLCKRGIWEQNDCRDIERPLDILLYCKLIIRMNERIHRRLRIKHRIKYINCQWAFQITPGNIRTMVMGRVSARQHQTEGIWQPACGNIVGVSGRPLPKGQTPGSITTFWAPWHERFRECLWHAKTKLDCLRTSRRVAPRRQCEQDTTCSWISITSAQVFYRLCCAAWWSPLCWRCWLNVVYVEFHHWTASTHRKVLLLEVHVLFEVFIWLLMLLVYLSF